VSVKGDKIILLSFRLERWESIPGRQTDSGMYQFRVPKMLNEFLAVDPDDLVVRDVFTGEG